MTDLVKWVDLKDISTKGRLKVMVLDDDGGAHRKYLVVVGMSSSTERWKRAISALGFVESPSKKYLIRQVRAGEKINAEMFRPVWPNAAIVQMPWADANMQVKGRVKVEKKQEQTEEERNASVELGEVIRLGRNADNEVVFKSPLGRYIERRGGNVFEGGALLNPALFLRANDAEQESICADGFVQAMNSGEVQHTDDFYRFMSAITDMQAPYPQDRINNASAAIEAAVMRHLTQSYQTPQDAYGESARLYEMLPPYQGAKRGVAAMPIPLAVMAQRLLGDTKDKSVVFPDAYDGAAFAFLPAGTAIRAFRGSKNISSYARSANALEAVWKETYSYVDEPGADAMFINKDPFGDPRTDYTQTLLALRGLKDDGRAVIVLASAPGEINGELNRESADFYGHLARNFEIEAAFEVPPQMTNRVGSNSPLRVVAIKNRRPRQLVDFNSFEVMNTWDECKSYVDEAIISVGLKEAETEAIDVDRLVLENEFQRPYISFSKTAEATTMVPKNLQGPLQYALSSLEYLEGEVDTFVESELQFGENTLGERFSPEQIDAIALGVHAIKQGRAPIVGDETGIGKGRTLSALAVWANKQGKSVIFITDKANLFSDLTRDLRHIGEWGRFNPMIMNANTVIIDGETKEVLHSGTPAGEVKNIVENMVPLDMTGFNMVFTTYSQIASEESVKAQWLLEQVPNALFISDESHVAAGSDSNMSRAVVDMQTRAWGVAYSSATWAKSSENLHIYSRSFPPAINISTLTTTMRSGGEAFAEVFSSMLAKDGTFIRREHDLSKLEIVVETDSSHAKRNAEIADKVAEVLGAMTFVGGEINRLLMRSNNDTISALRRARSAHGAVAGAMRTQRSQSRRGRRNQAADVDQTQGAVVEQNQAAVQPTAVAAVPVTMFKSTFGAGTVLYQVMRRVLATLNADNVARLALEAIAQQRKPVIVFEDTGETFIRQIIRELTVPAIEGDVQVLPTHIPAPTIRDLLLKVVSRMGVVQKRQTTDIEILNEVDALVEDGAEVDIDDVLTQRASGSNSEIALEDLPGLSESQREDYLEGLKRIVEMIKRMPPLPLNSIDIVRARLQSEGLRVGEISGRRVMLDMPESMRDVAIDSDWDLSPLNSRWKVAYRNKTKRAVSETAFGFNNGDLDVVLINRAAASGLSLHASPRFADRRRRELIEMQIPENPTDRIQLYGRVNRYDQVVGPRISIATTGIYGELRQLMMQNKKLAKLSANIRSSRDNAAEIKHVTDIINPVGEMICKRFLLENAPIRQRLGITDAEMSNSNISAATKLTSRLVLLRTSEQKMVYEELYSAYDEEIIRLDLAGKNPMKSRELDIRAQVVQSRIAIGVEMEGLGSAFDGPVYMRELAWKQDLRPITWSQVNERIVLSREELLKANVASLPVLERVDIPDLSEVSDEEEGLNLFPDAAAEAVGIPANNEAAEAAIEPGDADGAEVDGVDADADDDAFVVSLDDLAASINGVVASSARSEMRPLQEDRPAAEDVAEQDLLSASHTQLKKSIDAAYPVARSQALTMASLPETVSVQLEEANVKALVMSDRQRMDILTKLNLSKPLNLLVNVLADRSRLALAGSEFVDVQAALRSVNKNSVREMWAKRIWVEKHFDLLQPGCLIGFSPSSLDEDQDKKGASKRMRDRWENLFREKAVITALIPPPEGKEAQLSKWKIEVVVPGDEKPRQFSLSKLLEDVSLMPTVRGGENNVELIGGPDVYGFAYSGAPGVYMFSSIRNSFATAPRGYVDRKGYVLEGNMYLASEWAQATKKGYGVVYTDSTGVRHRAIMLSQSSLHGDRDLFNHLPIRLWVPQMIRGLVKRIWEQPTHNSESDLPPNVAGSGYLFKTDFASAMVDNYGLKAGSSQFFLLPRKLVAVALDRKELARASRAMRSEANRIFMKKHPHFDLYTPEQKAAANADLIKVKTTSKRGKQSMVTIEAETLAQAEVAVELISRAVGLELYIWPSSRAGRVASEIVSEYFEGRREEARSIRDAARERRELRATPSVVPAPAEQTSAQDASQSINDPVLAPVLRVANG